MNDEPKLPSIKGPALSCDCHMHVFGDLERYPYCESARNAGPNMPLEKFLGAYGTLHRPLGIERMVFVQPSTYGLDNSCLLDAMKLCAPNTRGIADVDESIADAELERMHKAGVRGVRINAGPPQRPYESGLTAKLLPRIQRLDKRCAELGWQLDLLAPGWFYVEMLDSLKKLKSDFTVAHFGMFMASAGAKDPGFQNFLAFLRHGDGHCWVKFTAPYRIAIEPQFVDSTPIAQAIIEAAPDRIIWGSDYPYLSNAHRVNSIDLFNLLGIWAPDEAVRRRILVDNPARLFGFP